MFRFDEAGAWIAVSPGAEIDITVELAPWLAGDLLVDAIMSAPGLSVRTIRDGHSVTGWFSGMTAGTTYAGRVDFVTAKGRKDSRVFRLVCRDR